MRSKIFALLLGLLIPLTVYAGLETATYIDGLVSTNPLATDPAHQGDDHLRLLKSTVKATFPNINAAVTPTDEVLNAIQTTANITSGTFADARISSSSVTQHMDDGYARNISSPAKGGTVKTLSTSGPSGGADGDIWYKY
jgi:hypothetical protein